jgi:predicted transposase YbfD/YdcC
MTSIVLLELLMSKESATFLDYFEDIEDPRSEKNKLYSAHEILLVTICALICGADSWRDLVTFGNEKLDFFREYLTFKEGIPCKNTFCRFFAALNPEEFKKCFTGWVNSLTKLKNEVIAIDGKRLCNSFDKLNNNAAIHMVSAFAAQTKLVLAQQKVDNKSNEITAIPKLLDLLNVKGNIITIDAMGTQKGIAKKIIDNQGDYILALKGNHSILHKDVIDFFNDNLSKGNNDLKDAREVDYGHGRIEERNCLVTDEINWLGELAFPGMKSIICIDSSRTIGDVTSNEKRYYISSLPANAVQINAAIRGHWTIENCLHWSLDVTFNEDNSRIRDKNAAENIAMVRHTALNLLQLSSTKYKGTSLKGLRKKAGWGNSTLRSILEQ